MQVALNRSVREAFSKFRVEHPDKYDWKESEVPESVSDEEKSAEKAEKKRVQRARRKLRKKLEKAKERQHKAAEVGVILSIKSISSNCMT